MHPHCGRGHRKNVADEKDNPPDPRDLEIQDLHRQVEILTHHLKMIEMQDQFDEDDLSSNEDFINSFHNQSLHRRQTMEGLKDIQI